MNPKTLEIKTELPITFLHEPRGADEAVVIFLHGYTDSGSALLRRSLKGHALPYSVLAPNGPFPLPVRDGDGFKEAFAWYFWEYSKNKVVIPPKVSVGLLKSLITHLGYDEKPKVIVGFSQGGFLAPYLLPELKNVKGLIAVGTAFREQDYPKHSDFPLTVVHGQQDQIITAERSRSSFEELMATNKIKGEFHEFKSMAHTIDEAASQLIRNKIEEHLGVKK